jgi:catechol 2,3-dioxygenase-like lactoylglutathione lyase family enzyme
VSIRRVVPNLISTRVVETRAFYTDVLGFQVAMDMGWVVTLASPSNPTVQISLLREPAPESTSSHPSLSIEVTDVDAVHAKALAAGLQIVYPLTTEPWGVRRFYVTDPNGVVINVMSHLK